MTASDSLARTGSTVVVALLFEVPPTHDIEGQPMPDSRGRGRGSSMTSNYITPLALPRAPRFFSPGNGPKARLMHPDWARSLRDQCQAAGVAFFFKQWGAWRPAEVADAAHRRAAAAPDWPVDAHVGAAAMVRVGKTAAGRLLDGREWDEFPRPRATAVC